jgi:hypothetical protein
MADGIKTVIYLLYDLITIFSKIHELSFKKFDYYFHHMHIKYFYSLKLNINEKQRTLRF